MSLLTSRLSIVLICCLLTSSVVAQDEVAQDEVAQDEVAQDEAARDEVAQDGETEAAEGAAAPTTAAAASESDASANESEAAEGASARAEFDAVFGQWKDLLQELRDIQTQYQVAEDDALADLKEQWHAKLDEGRTLVPAVRKAAVAAYRESPNSDRELTSFLMKLAADDIRADNFEAADELVQVLVDGECSEREIDNLAGIAAYGVHDFDRAEEHLSAIAGTDALTQSGRKFLGDLQSHPDLAELWQAELELREAEAQADDLPRVKLETTAGDFVIELFENEAPETVGNFVNLVEKGFYDDLTFHRVLRSFMAQGGCPLGTGAGGPGYKIYCECVNDNHRNHFRGSVSMAKSAARNTGGSQFFINFVPTPHLNGQHTVFGRVIEGMENLSKILKRDPDDPKAANAPSTKIIKAEVLRKRDHEYQPNKVQ